METATGAPSSLFIPSYFPLPHSNLMRSDVSKVVVSMPLFSYASVSIREPIIRSFSPKLRRCPLPSCVSPDLDVVPSRKIGILIEVDGVLADVYRLGNRKAFNVAFQKLGLDCANWTDSVYTDLKKKAASDEKMMLILFFNRVGWPTSLPTNEKEAFMKILMREKSKALEEFAMSSNLALRPGAKSFIDEAIQEGLPLVFLTAYSKSGDQACRSIIEKLGHNQSSDVKIIGKEEIRQSLYGQLVLGKGVSSGIDEQLAKEAQKAVSMKKQRVAEEVASILKLSVDIDTSSTEGIDLIVAALRAGAECAGLPVQDCVLIAGSQSSVVGAERIGMPTVVVRSSSTARTEFHKAKAVVDGFGGADLTVSKLLNKRFTDP